MRTRSLVRLVAAACALALIAAACGEDGEAGGDGERAVVRFAFAPDPVIDWLNDQGIIPEYEDDYNVRLVTTSSWDEFAFFAGGHGDIVSMATYETPVLEQETGVETDVRRLQQPAGADLRAGRQRLREHRGRGRSARGSSRPRVLHDPVEHVREGLARPGLLHRAAGQQ
jgi:hypothetical protein